jgi:nicotinamide-nucleotide amidase
VTIEVLNTGTELLLGQVVNTHLAWFGRELFPLGLRIARQTTLPDGAAIRQGLLEAFDRCDVLLVTGGLGPTTDDITREITAEILGRRLHEDATIVAAIEARLARRGFAFRPRMRRQAMVPEGATVLPNGNGTAPGLYFPATSTAALATPHLFLLPGPPRELRPMFADAVLPILRALHPAAAAQDFRSYHVVGLGESAVEERIGLTLAERGDLEVGYCARPNEVDFRLIGPRETLDAVEPLVLAALGDHLVSRGNGTLEEVVVGLLRAQGKTVALAESCTGGFLAHRLTNVPGASEVFPAGYVTYANAVKTDAVGVPAEWIAAHGAVSEPVARAMAEGALSRAGADFGIGITGIAGPGGGTAEKPVGTVFIALAERGQDTVCTREAFPTDRATFKDLTTQAALDRLRLRLMA